MYQLEIYNHFSLQTTRWHSKNLPYVHFEFLGLKKISFGQQQQAIGSGSHTHRMSEGSKWKLLFSSFVRRFVSLKVCAKLTPSSEKSTVKLGLTHKSYSVQIYRINSYFPRHFPKVFLILRKQNRNVLYTRQVHTLLFNPLCVYFSTYEGLFI